MSQAPEDSPNELTPALQVRRLNRVPLLIAGLLVSVLLAAVAYSYYARLAKSGAKPEDAQKPEAAPVFLKDAPDAGFIPREKEPPRPALAPLPKEPVAPPEPLDEARRLAWEGYRHKLERRRSLREEATLQAVLANTGVGFSGVKPAAAAAPKESEPLPQSERFADLTERLRRFNGFEDRDRDLNRAGEKRDFLKDRGPQSASQNRLAARREEPSSPFELKSGTIIPATMIGGVSNDLPGQILGQVSENVYDTATGRYILIPQGAKLVGIDVNKTYLIIFSLSIAIIGTIGVIFAMRHSAFPIMGAPYTMKSFCLIAMAGIGNITGILWYSALLGVSESIITAIPGAAGWADLVFFALIVGTILIRSYQQRVK